MFYKSQPRRAVRRDPGGLAASKSNAGQSRSLSTGRAGHRTLREPCDGRSTRAITLLRSRPTPKDVPLRYRWGLRRAWKAIAVVVSVVTTGLAYGVPPAAAANGTGPADLINVLALQGASPLYTATAAQQASLEDLEQQAVTNTVADHGLSSADNLAAQTWGRDAALAELWGLLSQAVNTPEAQRTTDQANAVAWLTNVALQENIAAADDAGLEYAKWAGLGAGAYENLLASKPTEAQLATFLGGGPFNYGSGESMSTPSSTSNEGYCVYVPPAPYTTQYTANIYTPIANSTADQDCFTSCTDQLTNCAPPTPTESQFEAFGAADADDQAFDNSAFPAVANDVGEAAGFGAALVGGGAAGVALSSSLSSVLLGSTLASVLSPYGGVDSAAAGAAIGSSQLAETSAGIAAADVGGAVAIVLAAIAIGVIEGINVVTTAQLPGQLAQLVYNAPTTAPDLASMLQSSASTTELYSLFIGSTLPEPALSTCDNSQLIAIEGEGTTSNPAPCLNAPPVPGPSESDATFNITEKGSTTTTTSNTLTWSDTAQGSTNSAYVVGNWFVNTESSGNASLTYQTLDIHYTNWSGTEEVAWLIYTPTSGYQFVIYEPDTTTPINPSTCVNDGTCALASSIEYVGTDGKDYTASLTGTGVPEGYVGLATTTSVTSSVPNPVLVGQPVTLTATISDDNASGSVTFTDGPDTLCSASPVNDAYVSSGDSNGVESFTLEAQASCTTTFTKAGSTQVLAAYSGGPGGSLLVLSGQTNWDEASTGEITLDVVNQVASTTTVYASDSNPVVGEPVTYTATVADSGAGPAPTGTVTFTNGTITLCSSALSTTAPYTASCSETYQSPGLEVVTASYPGDNYTMKSSNSTTVNVSKASSNTSLAASTTTPVVGQPVGFTATITAAPPAIDGPPPTGTVTFTDGSTAICSTVTLPATSPHSAVCSETYQAPGSHTVTADYSGDANTLGSSQQTQLTVGRAETQTQLSMSPSAPKFGQPVTFSAAVSAVAPSTAGPPLTGTVTFTLDGQPLATGVPFNGAQAESVSVYNLAPGPHSVVATYSGDGNYIGSAVGSSSTVTCTQTVNAPDSGSLTVTGSTCIEPGGSVSGTVTVVPGGALAVIGGTLDGQVRGNGLVSALICSTTIGGPLVLTGAAGTVTIGGPAGAACGPDKLEAPVGITGASAPVSIESSTLAGPLTISGGSGPVTITGNSIGRSLRVTSNSGTVNVSTNTVGGPVTVSSNTSPAAATVSANTITGTLSCSGNSVPPTDGGVLNTSSGPSRGQCAELG